MMRPYTADGASTNKCIVKLMPLSSPTILPCDIHLALRHKEPVVARASGASNPDSAAYLLRRRQSMKVIRIVYWRPAAPRGAEYQNCDTGIEGLTYDDRRDWATARKKAKTYDRGDAYGRSARPAL